MPPEKKLPKTPPEASTYRELAGSSYIVLADGTVARKLAGSSYIVLADGTVARKLKPRIAGQTRYWFLLHKNRLRCVSQKTVDEMTRFP